MPKQGADEAMEGEEETIIEVVVASARGLKRTSKLWKMRSMCVAWIDNGDPSKKNNKFFSKLDKAGDTHPAWNLHFTTAINSVTAETAIVVEVHTQEPVFNINTLHSSVRIPLKEFISSAHGDWQNGTFHLRSVSSGNARGMLDVQVRHYNNDQRVYSPTRETVSSSWQEPRDTEKEDAEAVTAHPAKLPPGIVTAGRPLNFPPPSFPYSYEHHGAAPSIPYANSNPPPYANSNPPYPYPQHNNPPYPYPQPVPFNQGGGDGSSYVGLPGPSRPPGGVYGRGRGSGFGGGAIVGAGVGGAMLVGMDNLNLGDVGFPSIGVSTDPLFYN